MRRLAPLFAAIAFGLVASSAPAADDPPSVREALSEVGHGVRNVTRETGHAFRDAAREAKQATREERKQVAEETGGVLDSLADALDELAAKIASWRADD